MEKGLIGGNWVGGEPKGCSHSNKNCSDQSRESGACLVVKYFFFGGMGGRCFVTFAGIHPFGYGWCDLKIG